MNKSEYKKLSHDIRAEARKYALIKGCSTRAELHGLCYWRDTYEIDKYGKNQNTYDCVGDYDTGLVWRKRRNVCNNVYYYI